MTLTDQLTAAIDARLKTANDAVLLEYPGDPQTRQPVHSFYGGADLFTSDACSKLGKLALRSLDENGPFPGVSDDVVSRVREKLRREPIEDYRIDFEDGYGNRPDAEEDGHAEAAAHHAAEAHRAGMLPPFLGIRIKPFTEELRARSYRTLDIFLTTMLEGTGGVLPPNFVVTLPKITTPMQPAALSDLFDILEEQLHLATGTLKFEFMVETTQSVLMLPEIFKAARGRCTGAHFGTYDYTASNGITAAHQHMLHPACDFARSMMKVALTGRGVFLSDGGTNIMPVGDRATVQRAWQLHFEHVRHSLINAFYQGWDLHPAQLVSRYAAVYSFFREGLGEATARLRNFLEKSAKATLTGDVFDDAATGLGLMNYLRRAVDCGAVSKEEVFSLSGVKL
jgi:citrate lyase beta subunit